jgi:endonuclease/exonuclease/phosphatase family metal-dependent hydrolase
MHVYFLPTIGSDGGEYGIALAAREEFRAAAERLPRVGDEEPRGAIVAAWRKIGIVTTHLARDAAARREQTAKLVDLAGKLGTPALVLGDMNQPSKDLAPLTDAGFVPVSAPKGRVGLLRRNHQIDHIMVSADVTVMKVWTVPTTVSDHSPLIAEVRVPGA